MRGAVIILSLVLLRHILCAQGDRIHVSVQSNVDTTDRDIASAIGVWEEYLNARPDSVYANPYWCESEQRRYRPFDLAAYTWWGESMYFGWDRWKPTVLSVSMADSALILRTMFSSVSREEPHRVSVRNIVQTAARRENGTFKLCNVLPINTRAWQRVSIGSITFISPPDRVFNRTLARRMSRFVDSLAAAWGVPPVPVEYYFADDFERVAKALGFDFWPAEGNIYRTRGVTDPKNRIIYGGGTGEWYPHEFVHIYVNPLFPHAHRYFLEGYATLAGGSNGQDLLWHIRRNYGYLKDHPETDILSFRGVDRFIGAPYVIGGLLCKLAEEKGGLPLIRRLMTYGGSDEDLYRALQDVFGVDREQLNGFLGAKLAELAAPQRSE